jgi:hypothetical protein
MKSFKKILKQTTALALIAAVSYPASVSASSVQSYAGINEQDSFEAISSRGMKMAIRDKGNAGEQVEQEDVSYLPGVETAKSDLKSSKASIISSPLLSHPQSYEDHQGAFQQKIRNVYQGTPLGECFGDFNNLTSYISKNLFKVSQHQLSRSYANNEWSEDRDLQTFLTFVKNKEGRVSVFIKGLDIAIPLYNNHRLSNLNSYTPFGSSLTSEEQKSAYLTNQLLIRYPDALRKGFKYLLKNKNTSEEDFFKFITGNNIVQLSQNTGISSQDQTWLGQHILPYLYKSCVQEKDKYYNNIGNFLTSEGLRHSEYKIGMNIADYLEYWSNKRWKMPGHFEKTFPNIYQEGVRLRAKEAGLGIPDTHFYNLSRDILPYLYKSCVQEAEKYYSNIGRFLTTEGLNHSKYTPGMNLADYLEYWSNVRWKMPGHFEKTFPGIYREGLEEKAKAKAKDFGISESDYNTLSKHILPYLYESCVHAKDKYYNNMWNFLTVEGLEHSKYNPGMNIADYLTYWSGRWEMPGLFEETFPEVYQKGLEEKAGNH